MIRNPALTANPLMPHPQVNITMVEKGLLQVEVLGQQAAARGVRKKFTNNE